MDPKTIKIKPSHPSQGDYVLINESDFDASIHEKFDPAAVPTKPAEAPPNVIEIPENWADLPWAEMKKLANAVAPEKVFNKDDAVAAIEAELARRAAI